MSEQDVLDQYNEHLALTSILDDAVFCERLDGDDRGGWFYAVFDLPENFHVTFTKAVEDCALSDRIVPIQHLPPLLMDFVLPEDYPSMNPPKFTLSSSWLSIAQLSQLARRLDEIWEANVGSVILYDWTSFLQNESFDYLGLSSPLYLCPEAGSSSNSSTTPDTRVIRDIPSLSMLPQIIAEYNLNRKLLSFSQSHVECMICLSSKVGLDCVCFDPCCHVSCKVCLREYICLKIRDGDVMLLTCPFTDCDTIIQPHQIKDLVPTEFFTRYDSLLLETTLQTMSDIILCPRLACQTPVPFDAEAGMAMCTACYLVFCPMCKLTYHGVSPCQIKNKDMQDLHTEYVNADDTMKKHLEKRYGKNVLSRITDNIYSEEWLEENCKLCPRCGAPIQKSGGCNKMSCTKCRGYFCWTCNSLLNKYNPYEHYTNPDSPCHNRLFYGADVDVIFEEF